MKAIMGFKKLNPSVPVTRDELVYELNRLINDNKVITRWQIIKYFIKDIFNRKPKKNIFRYCESFEIIEEQSDEN